MKKHLLILLSLFTLIAAKLNSQTENKNFLYWTDRNLSFEDFQGTPSIFDRNISELSFVIGYSTTTKEIDRYRTKWIETFTFVDKNSSWIKEGYKSDILLLYNQTIFNIAEVYSRKLQNLINELHESELYSGSELFNRLQIIQAEAKQRVHKLQEESAYGQNREVVLYWSKQIQNELKSIERVFLPNYQVTKFGIGLTFDLGYGLLTKSSSEYFSNNFNFSFGFDFGYDKWALYLRGIIGANSINKEFVEDNKVWSKDLKTNITVIEATVGYPLIDKSNYSLSPFMGIGGVGFSVRSQEEEFKDYSMGSFSPVFGINLDYKFGKSLNLLEGFWIKEKSSWILRTRLTVAPYNYSDRINGYSTNLTIGIGGFANFVSY